MGCHLLSSIFLFEEEKYSHGLLPSLFFFVIVLGVALGDFLLLLLTECFLICVRMCGGSVHHGSRPLAALQRADKPDQIVCKTTIPTIVPSKIRASHMLVTGASWKRR